MIELFAISKLAEHMSNNDEDMQIEGFSFSNNLSPSMIILSFIIACGIAYLAFQCNSNETPATRFLITVFAFLFSGLYLIYYFIRYVIMDSKCSGKGPSTILQNVKKNLRKVKKNLRKK